ncbi:MAG: LicD family protein [Anaerolineales bacterium]
MIPGIEISPAGGAIGVTIAIVLYAMTYLSFVRILRFPRNWMRPSLSVALPPVGLTIVMLAHTSLSSDGVDTVALWVLAGFIGVLFYIIAAPAIAFRPASRLVEFLARHGDYAGLWMLVPATIAAYIIPNAKLQGILAGAIAIELVWYLQRRWAGRRCRLLAIQGHDLAVLKVQAKGDLVGFARRQGIGELMLSEGTVAWRGCDKSTSPCPFNRYVNRLGLNTAPCCRERMKELCYALGTWLEEMEFVYWLEGGTLLGAVRENGELLPWEDDVDVSVLVNNDSAWGALVTGVSTRAVRDGYFVDAFERKGFIAISHAAPRRPPLRWENYRLRGEVRLDLTAYRPVISQGEPVLERRPPKGRMHATDSGGYGVAQDLVLPTSTITFLGRDFACPRRTDDYLRVLYGDFNQIAYSYVDAGPAETRRQIDTATVASIKH